MNERTLCHIWNSLAFRRDALVDTAGQPLQVVYRGRWQHGAGPDFRGAIIARADGSLLRGDVEMHVRTADWAAHGHQHDPAFNSVVLHVVLHHGERKTVRREDGAEVPTLALADFLDPAVVSDQAAPPDQMWSQEACRAACRVAPPGALAALLDEAGDARLSGKAARFEGELTALPAEEVLYRGLVEALGYSQNTSPARELASRVTLAELTGVARGLAAERREAALTTVLLGAAGLDAVAESGPAEDWRSLLGWPASAPSLGANRWRLSGLRPANRPDRRLRGLARLLTRTLDQGLVPALCLDWPEAPPRALCLKLREAVTVDSTDGSGGALVGPGRAADIVVNVLLPFAVAYANAFRTPELGARAWQAYHAHPRLSENEFTAYMAGILFANGEARGTATSARRQQGLLHLFRAYCDYRRCDECPVPRLAA